MYGNLEVPMTKTVGTLCMTPNPALQRHELSSFLPIPVCEVHQHRQLEDLHSEKV